MTTTLTDMVSTLERLYGRPQPPEITEPLEMILWENVAYLVDEKRRRTCFDRLLSRIGLRPGALLEASDESLRECLEDGGMRPEHRAEKVRRAAREACVSHPIEALKKPLRDAVRDLMRFPGIGEPGAQRILLFNRVYPLLALDSNGLRVLLRLGYGRESKNYATTYHSVQEAVASQLPLGYDELIRLHQLLQLHGQRTCRLSHPHCSDCPLAPCCPSRS